MEAGGGEGDGGSPFPVLFPWDFPLLPLLSQASGTTSLGTKKSNWEREKAPLSRGIPELRQTLVLAFLRDDASS